ncbi:MAG TPA: tRNA pseudouridine(55) synthase TruB [Gemmatimonadaceae bacterium]|nr:tRNA pseudouridine(55) synthase TruB [Gemmatimonadaceae bacterium]
MTSTEGMLLVDKPAGLTSQDVVSVVRRAIGASRAGHTGTLDPFATGLMVVLAGSATRLARFTPSEPKTYEAVIRFGVATETDDRTGAPTESAPLPHESSVRVAISRLTGEVSQVPPDYSAKQVGGRRAYALARRGEPARLEPVTVHVHEWEIREHSVDTWRVRITCGTGTYIRALARDLGRLAGSAAHLLELRRLSIGPFDVRDALPLDAINADTRPRAMVDALVGIPRERLDEASVEHVRHGRAVTATVEGARAALLDPDGTLVAIADRLKDQWWPRVVLVAS